MVEKTATDTDTNYVAQCYQALVTQASAPEFRKPSRQPHTTAKAQSSREAQQCPALFSAPQVQAAAMQLVKDLTEEEHGRRNGHTRAELNKALADITKKLDHLSDDPAERAAIRRVLVALQCLDQKPDAQKPEVESGTSKQEVLKSLKQKFAACFKSEEKWNTDELKVEVTLTRGMDGVVTNVNIENQSSVGTLDAKIESCLRSHAQRALFPRTAVPPVDLKVPVILANNKPR
jgi:hypothetical protein